MPDWEAFKRDFDYDAFANKLWLASLEKRNFPDPDRGIFAHMLSASDIWLQRVNGGAPTSFPVIETTEAEIERLQNGWKQALSKIEGDPILDYRRTNGDPHSARIWDVVHHVVYHGTYHRGELRGLCLSRGEDNFPETDYILFALTHPE